jgi:HK97 family phage major capsid protein
MDQKQFDEMMSAVKELRRYAEEGPERDTLVKNALEKVNARLDQIEAQSKARPGSAIAEETRAIEVSGKKRAAVQYIRKGFKGVKPEDRPFLVMAEAPEAVETKALSVADDTAGGYFVLPEVITNEIIKNVVQYSPIRQFARVRTTSMQSVKIPVRTSPTAAAWTGETSTRTASTSPAFGMKEISTHEMYALLLFSRQLLEDSVFDIEAELRAEISEQFAVLEAAAFVNGDGNGKPMGILTDANVLANQVTGYGGASITSADKLITMAHALKSPYVPNARWYLNRATLGIIRGLKDSQNRYIWEPALPNNNPATIIGSPYTECVDMPDVAANALPIVYGDLGRAYSIVDRTAIAVQRLEETYATTGQLGLLAYKRVGGQVVLSEAIRVLKMA